MNTIQKNAATKDTTSVAQAMREGITFQIGDRRYRLTRLKASRSRQNLRGNRATGQQLVVAKQDHVGHHTHGRRARQP